MNQILKTLNENWSLTLVPNAEVCARGFDPHTAAELDGAGYCKIPASVPGNFELDLVAAGLAPDPYFGQNPFVFQQYENRHLWYVTHFESDRAGDENTFLRFDGIDTVADIWLNGELLGHVENMLIEHEFCVCGRLKSQNELIVHIYPTVIEARKTPTAAANMAVRYNYASLTVRKCASMFGWDIMPRFVSGGLWKPVTLIQKPKERLEQFYLYTTKLDEEKNLVWLAGFYELLIDRDDSKVLTVSMDMTCGDSVLHNEQTVWHTCGHIRCSLEAPKLWFPRNVGEQNLYDVKVRLLCGDEVLDEKSFRFGVRMVELIRTSTTDEDGNGEFLFRINGKRVFCLGTNWVPMDAFHSRDLSRLQPALDMLLDINCNMVRCWGGNVYENDAFYDYCDEHGIMIWQDFGMGCAIYPQDAKFCDKIYREAVSVIKRLRHHAALILWAGDNENDIFCNWNGFKRDPNPNILTRQIIPRALREHDEVRPYLPSSPYVDEEAFRTKRPLSEDHLWGPRDDFKGSFYGTSLCHFASETGYHGCPSPRSLEEFISADQMWPMLDENGDANPDLICHASEMQATMNGPYAYRIGLMHDQVEMLFGAIPDTLSEFAKLSQISQAEADKYFIERFRVTKWRRTGIVWWNLLDGWPQISDAVVDWYYRKKIAYHYIKRSQAPICMMFDEPRDGKLSLYVVNDLSKDVHLIYTLKDLTTGMSIAEGEVDALADSTTQVLSVPAFEDYHFLFIEWTASDGLNGNNHYVTKLHSISPTAYLSDMHKAGYDCFEGF